MNAKILVIVTALIMGQAFALEVPQICVGCHANNGDSLIPEYPKLIGQNKQYLVNALKAYRSGERVSATMQLFAQPLTDEEIEFIADFYSTQ